MLTEIRAILGFLRDSIGKIMIILGAFFVIIAVLLMSRVYQWGFSLSLLFGVTLMIIGSAVRFESFKWKVPSLQGFGTILVYTAPLFMTAAAVTAIFAVPGEVIRRPMFTGGLDEHGLPWASISPGDPKSSMRTLVVLLGRPYAWLAAPLMITSLGLLAFGCLLKFARDTF